MFEFSVWIISSEWIERRGINWPINWPNPSNEETRSEKLEETNDKSVALETITDAGRDTCTDSRKENVDNEQNNCQSKV